mgnify:CR=1 FL=1
MLVTAVLFVPVAMWYKEKTYIQDEEADAESTNAAVEGKSKTDFDMDGAGAPV